MRLFDVTIKLLGLSETIHRWRGALAELDAGRREKVARYAEAIAATLARAAAAFAALERDSAATRAEREAIRELGRIAGYVEDIVAALEQHLDGRKARRIFVLKFNLVAMERRGKVSEKSLAATTNSLAAN